MASTKPQREVVAETESRREGSRWVGEFPLPEDVAHWFSLVHLHDEMEHAHYLPGLTLITSSEKVKRINGDGKIVEVERLVHVPYAKVETRVAYFWDLCFRRGWLGKIEPVNVPRVNYQNMVNMHLPPGFFRVPVQGVDGKFTHFVASSMKVTIFERDLRTGGQGRVVLDAPPATKQIAMVDRFNTADPFAMMKAETGAVGRALGMAGMLALPGSGVATAEDMLEALAGARGGNGLQEVEAEVEAPVVEGGQAPAGVELIQTLMTRLQSDAPGRLEVVVEWAKGRNINLASMKPTQHRAVIGQLERQVAELDEQ